MKRLKCSILILNFTVFINCFISVESYGKLTTNENDGQDLTGLTESAFRPAKNSDSYLILSKDHYKDLSTKIYAMVNERKSLIFKLDSLESLIINSTVQDTLLESSVDINNSLASTDIQSSQNDLQPVIIGAWVLIFALLIFLGRIYLRYRKLKKEFDDYSGGLEKELVQCKRNAIERERKLLRDLLDTKLKLEEYVNKEN